jgi:hypothetical protein
MVMVRKNKKTLIGVFLLLTFIAVITIYSFKDNIQLMFLGEYEFVIKGDKDNIYERLLLVKKNKSETEYNRLIDTLLNRHNTDLLIMEAAIRYVKENHLTEHKQRLKSIQNHFDSIPNDSIWMFKVSEGKYRSNGLKDAHIVPYLSSTIKELE